MKKIILYTFIFLVPISHQLLKADVFNIKKDKKKRIDFESGEKEVMVFDVLNNKAQLPRNFRTPKKLSFDIKQNSSHKKYGYSLKGFKSLNISGSSQFSEKNFSRLIKKITYLNKKEKALIYFVDLRKEGHFFINGHAISLYKKHNEGNQGLSPEEIESIERERVKNLLSQEKVKLFHIEESKNKGALLIGQFEKISPKTIQTERELVESQGFIYKRFPLQDHLPPTEKESKELVQFLKSIPPNAWIHFHCRAGKGRTTTLMMMMDMIKNKSMNNLSLDHFVRRHAAIGGSDFFRIQSLENLYIYDMVINRLKFIKNFYEIIQNKPQ